MTKKIARREALKFGIAGVAGLAVVSVIKEAAAAPPAPAPADNLRTLILPLPPLELAPGAAVPWFAEPCLEAFKPTALLLWCSETPSADRAGVPATTHGIGLRRMMIGEEDMFVGLLPSVMADLPQAGESASSGVLTVALRDVAVQIAPSRPLMIELHNPTSQVWYLHGMVFGFGNKPI